MFGFVKFCLNLFDFVWITQLCTNFVLVNHNLSLSQLSLSLSPSNILYSIFYLVLYLFCYQTGKIMHQVEGKICLYVIITNSFYVIISERFYGIIFYSLYVGLFINYVIQIGGGAKYWHKNDRWGKGVCKQKVGLLG